MERTLSNFRVLLTSGEDRGGVFNSDMPFKICLKQNSEDYNTIKERALV